MKLKRSSRFAVATVALAALASLLLSSPTDAQTQYRGEQENYYAYWDMAGQLAWNLDAHFTVTDVVDGTYYSQVFDFDTGGGGYMGLQQLANGDRVALFSMWRGGAAGDADIVPTGHANCQTDPGQENGGGTQCFLDFDWQEDTSYIIRVWRLRVDAQTDTWGAWVRDSTGAQQQIGTISIEKPQGQASEIYSTVSFVENFASIDTCEAPGRSTVNMDNPTINGSRATLAYSGTNEGSSCADGSIRWVGSAGYEVGIGTGGIPAGTISTFGSTCMDLEGPDTDDGTPVQVWSCADVANQQWQLSNGEIRGYGDKCLDVRGPSTADGTPVQVWDCVGVSNQQWSYTIGGQIIGYGGNCLTVADNNITNGRDLVMSTCEFDQRGQRWLVK